MRILTAVLALVITASTLACDSTEETTEPIAPTDMPQIAPGSIPVATPCTRDDPACMPGSPDDYPGLPDEEAARAIEIAVQDAILKELLAGVDYEIRGAGKWELRGEIIGVVVSIVLTQPLPIDHELPAIDIGVRGPEGNETYLPLPPPYYIERPEHYEIEARSLSVNVDLNREKVVEIFPLPFPVE